MANPDAAPEWLEADGLGGFASGPVRGPRTRGYHGWLLAATTPPTGRYLLVSDCEVFVVTQSGRQALASQRYEPDVVHPGVDESVVTYHDDPWPTWTWRCADGIEVVHELFVTKGRARVISRWRLASPRPGVELCVRPLIAARDPHVMTRESQDHSLASEVTGRTVTWRPLPTVPAIVAISNGSYVVAPYWYRNFLYSEERARGLNANEDLLSPGEFRFDLSAGEAWIGFSTASWSEDFAELASAERARRAGFATALERAGDAYVVTRGSGKTIIAGYPWFTDWGRDTFIAMRGLCIASGQLEDARRILVEWATAVDRGMLPNRFVESGEPEFNSVDASLWYVIAVWDWIAACPPARQRALAADFARVRAAVLAILSGYANGTRHGIRLEPDGLLAAGEPGVQLTWMDAKVGDWVVTPRIGKPVEVQALWLNACWIASQLLANQSAAQDWKARFERGRAAFRAKFWNSSLSCLYDVVDCDHVAGKVDAAVRPNQIFAVGGLPQSLLAAEQAAAVLATVDRLLLTPLGLRTLDPGDPGYRGRYQGGVRERDGAYHQGTVWPWLLGPFAEAWRRVHGAPRVGLFAELDRRFQHGHLPEIADGDAPHAARGCPFQAWSVGERLRARVLGLG